MNHPEKPVDAIVKDNAVYMLCYPCDDEQVAEGFEAPMIIESDHFVKDGYMYIKTYTMPR